MTWLIRVGATLALLCGQGMAAAAGPCETAEHRQFDFWVGEWTVHKADGSLAGENRITREFGGCVLRERYHTPAGYAGESLNVFDARRQRWHQTWVDVGGALLLLEGGLVDGRMVLEGEGVDAEGTPLRHRITWTPLPDGRVRQHWESRDAAGQWSTAFDGTYTRK